MENNGDNKRQFSSSENLDPKIKQEYFEEENAKEEVKQEDENIKEVKHKEENVKKEVKQE